MFSKSCIHNAIVKFRMGHSKFKIGSSNLDWDICKTTRTSFLPFAMADGDGGIPNMVRVFLTGPSSQSDNRKVTNLNIMLAGWLPSCNNDRQPVPFQIQLVGNGEGLTVSHNAKPPFLTHTKGNSIINSQYQYVPESVRDSMASVNTKAGQRSIPFQVQFGTNQSHFGNKQIHNAIVKF